MKLARHAAALLIMSVAVAASAQPSQETIWYGSAHPASPSLDNDTLQANIALIQDCLNENKHDKASCIGITKSYCHDEQPTCNIQEAYAWIALSNRKHTPQPRILRSIERACAYVPGNGGFTINTPDAWAAKLAPSGCVLQHAAGRVAAHHDTHAHKKLAKKKTATASAESDSAAPAATAAGSASPSDTTPEPVVTLGAPSTAVEVVSSAHPTPDTAPAGTTPSTGIKMPPGYVPADAHMGGPDGAPLHNIYVPSSFANSSGTAAPAKQ